MCPVNPIENRKRWKKGAKKWWNIQNINGKIVDLNPIISIVALNLNGFNQGLASFF